MSRKTTNTTSASEAREITIYSSLTLFIYNYWVLWISMTYAWLCPTRSVLLPYFLSLTTNSRTHLDIGVGTGYFPAALATRQSSSLRKIVLVDLNENALKAAAAALRRARKNAGLPEIELETVVGDARNVKVPVGPDAGRSGQVEQQQPQKFDSISLYLLLHCVPDHKDRVFAVAKEHLAPGGTVFGATVLGDQDENTRFNWFGRYLLRLYNEKGVFSNLADTRKQFAHDLRSHFDWVEEELVGNVWMFRARCK